MITHIDYETIDWAAERTDEQWSELAQQLRELAEGKQQDAHDSFERCDTDGFMSQWASGLTSRAYSRAASIAENHGWIEVRALFTLDGKFLTLDKRESQNYGWGWYWNIPAPIASAAGVKRFINDPKAGSPVRRARTLAKHGVAIGTMLVRPIVKFAGGSLTSVSVVAEPDLDLMAKGEFQIVRTNCGDLFDTTAPNSRDWFRWTPEDLAAKLA